MQFFKDLTGERCFPACLGTLLGIHPSKLPNFYADQNPVKYAWEMVRCISYQCGYKAMYVKNPPSGWAIAHGHGHACLVYNGEIMHDPTPNGGGLRKIDGYTILINL